MPGTLHHTMARIRTRWLLIAFAVACLVLIAWITADLAIPAHHSLQYFDGLAVGRLETAMWRSYYDHEPVQLFAQLATLLRTQYHFSFWRSYLGAYYGAHAAIVFQRGHERADYEKALPDLRRYYGLVREGSESVFDVEQAARLELEWWIIHRERARRRPGDLEFALAQLQEAIYRVPAARFEQHARARAQAMLLRDTKAEAGKVRDTDWAHIENLLDVSWQSLQQVVEATR